MNPSGAFFEGSRAGVILAVIFILTGFLLFLLADWMRHQVRARGANKPIFLPPAPPPPPPPRCLESPFPGTDERLALDMEAVDTFYALSRFAVGPLEVLEDDCIKRDAPPDLDAFEQALTTAMARTEHLHKTLSQWVQDLGSPSQRDLALGEFKRLRVAEDMNRILLNSNLVCWIPQGAPYGHLLKDDAALEGDSQNHLHSRMARLRGLRQALRGHWLVGSPGVESAFRAFRIRAEEALGIQVDLGFNLGGALPPPHSSSQ